MGNSGFYKYHKSIELREKQHLLFYQLQAEEISLDVFRNMMMKYYAQMDTSFLGYHTLLKNGLITDRKNALLSKYEFNLEAYTLDPFPIGYSKNKL